MAAELFIAGLAATLQAISTWVQLKDSKYAAETFQKTFDSSLGSPQNQMEARMLEGIVPAPVLDTMLDRAKKCWDRYHYVLKGGFLPQEIDEATHNLKLCLCRELSRILELNGSIPDGTCQKAWEQYCKNRQPEQGYRM